MKNKRNKEFWKTGEDMCAAATHYYNQLIEIAISSFEWVNLPETVDRRFLELTLLFYGNAVFFKDEELGYLALQSASNGPFNVYRIPKNRTAYAVNGYRNKLNEKNSVLIYNNMLHTGGISNIRWFANRLAQFDEAIDVNVNAQKTPILIECDEDNLLSMKNAYMQYTGNAPVIFSKKNAKIGNGFNVLKTDAPFIGREVYELKSQIWNEALTFLGISNVNIVKKERLISDEVRRNLGGTIANRNSRLEARRIACDQLNSMFGLNVSCTFKDDSFILNEDSITEKVDALDNANKFIEEVES